MIFKKDLLKCLDDNVILSRNLSASTDVVTECVPKGILPRKTHSVRQRCKQESRNGHVILKDLKNPLNESEKRFLGCSDSRNTEEKEILNKHKSTQSEDCLILKLFRMTCGGKEILRAGALRMTGAAHDKALPRPTGEGNNNVTAISRFTSHVSQKKRAKRKAAFTLAEVLITLGIIGVVAAVVLPTLNANIQKKVRAEQIRTVKYKFTKATTKMASLGLIGPYNNTAAFVAELQKHLKIAKVCPSTNLRACWPYDTVILQDGKEYDITKATTGKAFKMTSSDTADYTSNNVGIVTADGTPMIISFNTKCDALDPIKTYTWSTEDNKPVTNATTSCVAAIFEVNGTGRPNKFSEDVVAFNANGLGSSCAIELPNGKCFGAAFTPTPMTKAECEAAVAEGKLGIQACYYDSDYWAGAVKQCGGTGNMPTLADLGQIASAIYDGNPSIGAKEDKSGLTYTSGTASSLGLPEPTFYLWSGEEYTSYNAYYRYFYPTRSSWSTDNRYNSYFQAMCLGD